MTRQLPVMQLQSFSYPKNVSALSSPSLTTTTTSSLINNNSLLTFRDIMMHHQYQQQQQQLQNQERHQKTTTEVVNEPATTISTSTPSSSSLSPNTSAKFSPKRNYAVERNEMSPSHPLSINKTAAAATEACENGSKISINRSTQNKADTHHHPHHHHNNSSAKTVREELEQSRNKIPKLGEFTNPHDTSFSFFIMTICIKKSLTMRPAKSARPAELSPRCCAINLRQFS